MRARTSTSGFTLVEMIVAIGLATILIGVLIGATVQIQRAVTLASARQDGARVARSILNDLERDLGGLVPQASAPAPFGGRALEIEAVDPRPGTPRDRVRMLTTVRDIGGDQSLIRGRVEFALGELRDRPGGGPQIGTFLRTVDVDRGGVVESTTAVLGYDVVSFELEWQDNNGVFQAPTADTASGDAFSFEGTVNVAATAAGTQVSGSGSGAALLDSIPIGDELRLEIGGAPTRFLVRRRLGPGQVLINDRLAPQTGLDASAFRGPMMLRATLVMVVGRGADAPTARFSRALAVPR